jgi:hypothetical protein
MLAMSGEKTRKDFVEEAVEDRLKLERAIQRSGENRGLFTRFWELLGLPNHYPTKGGGSISWPCACGNAGWQNRASAGL